jgi:hypothetical protein
MQLRIHTQKVLKIAYLEAPESPRRAFYLLWIEKTGRGFRVCKESGVGAGCTTLHRKAWEFDTIEEAEKLFSKVVRRKTRPNRKSPRQYRAIRSAEAICALSSVSGVNVE